MSASRNTARPQRVGIKLHNGAPLDADPNGNRAQRRAAAKLGIKSFAADRRESEKDKEPSE
jgi:hypothetical protein